MNAASRLGSRVATMSAAVFGVWNAPPWMRGIGALLSRGTSASVAALRARPRAFAVGAVALVLLAVGGHFAWQWWKARPQPVEVGFKVVAPALTDFANNGAPRPLVVDFSRSVAPLALVGKDVLIQGDRMSVVDGIPQATFEIGSAASRVKVEVLNPAGRLIDTINLATTAAGRHDVPWPAGKDKPDAASHRFVVTATTGSTKVDAVSLTRDKVDAVNTGGTSLTVELERSGRVPYNQITALD